ncbi:MAG TPA: L-dopachrome tautomerase-related protein [Thermoanaerobaculia bacterium]|nr:L-dopachrome tautomerase-related protein [Thermoanaerobaculia bacterium]
MKRFLAIAGVLVLVLLAALILTLRIRYGGATQPFPDRTSAPLLGNDRVEIVATLPEPPGNIAVADDGRVFFTYHPEARPEWKVLQLVDGKPVPYPSLEWQKEFVTPLSVRIDKQGRLWVLDLGFHGMHRPRLIAFDLKTGARVYQWRIPPAIAGFGSFVQDFQIDPAGRMIYLADLSILAKRPALIVFDTQTRECRRVLENHPSVKDGPYRIVARGTPMEFLGGLYKMHPALDSIALDRNGEWLYYGAMSNDTLYRVRTDDLQHVEAFGRKPQTDGIAIDDAGNVYMTEVEHGTVAVLRPDRTLHTLVRDERFRWPDGLSLHGDWLYMTDSALAHVILRSRGTIRNHAPYFLYRVRIH